MSFNASMKMAELVHQNYLLLPILNRFDIQLGFKDQTIKEVCTRQKINTDFFLVIVNSFHDHDYFPQEQLLGFPLSLILEYIKKSHKYYLDIKVPQIDELIKQLIRKADESRKKELSLIEKFFEEYKAEIREHILDEEERVYPYVQAIDLAFATGEVDDKLLSSIREQPIIQFQEGHTNVEDKLFDLKNIIIKYLPPLKDNTLSNSLLIELFRLERDLNDHARIEEKVLVPKVEYIETEILNSRK